MLLQLVSVPLLLLRSLLLWWWMMLVLAIQALRKFDIFKLWILNLLLPLLLPLLLLHRIETHRVETNKRANEQGTPTLNSKHSTNLGHFEFSMPALVQ